MFCKNCGNQVDDKAVICTSCGCLTDLGEKLNLNQLANQQQTQQTTQQSSPSNSQSTASTNNTLGTIAKVFMIISTVFMGFYIIPLAWTLPMTISLSNKLKNREPISVGFKVCILLFVNTIAGILLLCMKDENQ